MTLNGCRSGDIVQVDGRLAFVNERRGRHVRVRFAHGTRETRSVTSYDVEAHWRKSKA